jgi:hypothetical protein
MSGKQQISNHTLSTVRLSLPCSSFHPYVIPFCFFTMPPLTYTSYPQSSYPLSDTIPLRLTLTSERREALDLFTMPNGIDVRLEKVLAFGEQVTAAHLGLGDRRSFHRTDLAARAHWQLNGRVRELLPDEGHPRPRWNVELDGSLHRETKVELSPSFEEPGMALVVR